MSAMDQPVALNAKLAASWISVGGTRSMRGHKSHFVFA
jgi:hypothetical protein